MNYRFATIKDAENLDNLLTKLINDERENYDNNIEDNFVVKDFYKNCLVGDNRKIFLVEENDLIVGYIYLIINEECKGIIDALYVEKDYRNRGIASKLIDMAITWFKKNGVKNIEISVMKENEVAEKLYISKGFKVFKEVLKYE